MAYQRAGGLSIGCSEHLWLLGLSTVGYVIFLGILQALKEGLFAALDAIPDFRKIAAFEDGLGKLKPLL